MRQAASTTPVTHPLQSLLYSLLVAAPLAAAEPEFSDVLTSDDDGQTWAAPQDVTRTTNRPARATTIASSPGSGIELSRGPHKDRLIIPFNEGPYGRWQNYAVFSDDGGRTWTWGDDVPGALVPDGKGGERSQINEVHGFHAPLFLPGGRRSRNHAAQ